MSFDKKKESPHIPNHDANNKVFAAILKTLINMENNTPTSPKALADTIVKHRGQPAALASPKRPHHIDSSHDSQLSMDVKRNRTLNPFQIKEIVIGNMQCYQLNDEDEIKVLRFIALIQPKDDHKQSNQLKKDYINATHLRKAATPVLGEGIFDTQKETLVVIITKGPLESRGAWVPLYRARELIEEFEIESSVGLTKLLSDHPVDSPANISIQREKPVVIIPSRKHAKIAPSTKHLTASEILKSMNIQALNLSALQHMMAVMPHLASQILPPQPQPLQSIPPSPSTSPSPILVETPPPPPSIPIVYPIQPTDPPMTITLLDNVTVCIAILRKQEEEEGTETEYRLMRRLDTGYINGTQLLTAGGIDTESERSMILSFEMSRVRILNKASQLYGTWIPCRRAQELAATCSIQHKLGPFLDGDVESLFPSPLPAVKRRQSVPVPIPLTEEKVLLTHPHHTLKIAEMNTQHAPLLGCFSEEEGENGGERQVKVIDPSLTVKHESESDNEETDTDDDVEQVRKEMRRKRDAAIAAMAIGGTSEQPLKIKKKQRHRHHRHRKEERTTTTGGKWSAAKMVSQTKSVIIIKKKDLKKKDPVTHTMVNEDDEDEDVDIGGSDNDDDLR
ncbi:hypothetical protein INT47_012032 [Mucor saturninus]|uniref:HTH APSES-type domain-containing protein n=1 Tax=Mucor saturninus TaxID=64648 RepID=A0A8H7UX93_9FUNG|nr:hypothetical protein INT47_012032 [Mucor saturninus]